MKILVTHPKQWQDSPLQKELGIEVRHVSLGGDLPKRLDGSVSFDGIGEVATELGILTFLDEVKTFQPDVLLFGIHFNLTADVIKRSRRLAPNMRCAMHYTDQRDSVPSHVRQYVGSIEALLVTNKDARDHAQYRNLGGLEVRTFYDGVDAKIYRPKAIVPEFDCYFGGNDFYGLDSEMRRKHQNAEKMLAKFPGSFFRQEFLGLVNDRFRLVIRGQWGWDKSRFNVKQALFCPREVDGMLEARIILSTFNVKLQGLITRRMLRSLASGRMFLTEHCLGMEDLFTNHKHLVWFERPEEGLDLIRYYLEHPAERDRIASAGRAHVAKRHSFDCRLRDFVNIVREVF
jgi:hypothetical protein